MSLWEFNAAFAGWKRANSAPDDTVAPPTAEQHAQALAFASTIH